MAKITKKLIRHKINSRYAPTHLLQKTAKRNVVQHPAKLYILFLEAATEDYSRRAEDELKSSLRCFQCNIFLF